MYIVCLDFSENSLLTEQLNVRSFYDLPVLNSSLLHLQLINFSDVEIERVFILDNVNSFKSPLFETVNADLTGFYKILFTLDNDENVMFIRNDVYFEFDFSEYINTFLRNKITALVDETDFCYALICSVNELKRLYTKNINPSELMADSLKFTEEHIKLDGYRMNLKTVKSYKSLLFDILNGKTLYKPPHIAEGIFTDGSVPKGDFSIIPPVYLSETSQIESGSTIGPNVVIYNNSLISSETTIKNSILFENVFVSSNCYIDGTVCCENSSVKRHSAVFSGSVIGENALIGEDMIVENNALIKKNVKYDKIIKSPLINQSNHSFEYKFQGLSPDKASILGSALATVFNKPKIVIVSDGSPNSLSIKLALLSGLIASGGECFDIGTSFKSLVFFSLLFCECDFSVFIRGKNGGTDIEIFNSRNEALGWADCYNLFDFCSKKEVAFVEQKYCKSVRQIYGLRKMYIREIASAFEDLIDFEPIINCKNEILSKTLHEIFAKVGSHINNPEKIYIDMNYSGTNVNIKYNDEVFSQKTLKKIVFFYNKKGNNVFCNKYYEKLWKRDSIILLFSVFLIMKKSNKNLKQLTEELPDFFVSSKSVEKSIKAGELSEKISSLGEFFYKAGSYNIPLENSNIKIQKRPFSDKIKILCSSENFSNAEEICNFIFDIFKDI